MNAYRSQRSPDGGLALPGLVFVGDSVYTTTPNFGRGLATTMLQVDEVLRLLDAGVDVGGTVSTAQLNDLGEAFDAWTEATMRPWVEDHAVMGESLRRRWVGGDVDLSGPRLPSDLVMEASRVDERIAPAIGPVRRHAGAPLGARPGPAARPRRLRDRLAAAAVGRAEPPATSTRSSSRRRPDRAADPHTALVDSPGPARPTHTVHRPVCAPRPPQESLCPHPPPPGPPSSPAPRAASARRRRSG
ncbi:MAG: hypothetical protein ABJA74_00145 [Lapillicoccus sp.]